MEPWEEAATLLELSPRSKARKARRDYKEKQKAADWEAVLNSETEELYVLAMETGGRFGAAAMELFGLLAQRVSADKKARAAFVAYWEQRLSAVFHKSLGSAGRVVEGGRRRAV